MFIGNNERFGDSALVSESNGGHTKENAVLETVRLLEKTPVRNIKLVVMWRRGVC